MSDITAPDGPWAIVVGELDASDATTIHLHRITLDGELVIPVFRDPQAFRRALAETPAADKAMRITIDLLRATLGEDDILVFDDGIGDPVRLTARDLHLLEADNA